MVNSNLAYRFQELEEEIDYTYLPNKLKYISVSLTEIFNNKLRLEANAFNIETKVLKDKIINNKSGYTTIAGLCKSYRPGITKRNYVNKKDGVPMYTPTQITEIQPKSYKYLSKEQIKELSDWILVKGELVLTCSGTVGKVSMISKTLSKKVFSQNMIRLYDYDYMGYIYTFLQSKTGNKIITSNNYGAVIKHIDPEHLEGVVIPNAPKYLKKEIHDLILKSYNLRDQSNVLIDKAEAILYNELQLKPIQELCHNYYNNKIDLRNYTTKLSHVNFRFDSSYHLPIFDTILNHLEEKSFEIKYLSNPDVTKSITLPGRFKRTYVESEKFGIKFIGGKQIFDLNPNSEKFLSKSIHGTRLGEQLILKENCLLITRSGTIGKVVLVPRHWDNWAANEHIIRVFPKNKEIAGYIFCWLNSEYGLNMIKKHTYGAVVDEIDTSHVGDIPLPLLKNKSKQKEINDLVLKANDLRYKAHLKEQEALKQMENILNDTNE